MKPLLTSIQTRLIAGFAIPFVPTFGLGTRAVHAEMEARTAF